MVYFVDLPLIKPRTATKMTSTVLSIMGNVPARNAFCVNGGKGSSNARK